jgi:IS30 family transposase
VRQLDQDQRAAGAPHEGVHGAGIALESFTRVLNGVPEPMRKTLTDDQGKEMSEHKRLTDMTGGCVLFADPHNPW